MCLACARGSTSSNLSIRAPVHVPCVRAWEYLYQGSHEPCIQRASRARVGVPKDSQVSPYLLSRFACARGSTLRLRLPRFACARGSTLRSGLPPARPVVPRVCAWKYLSTIRYHKGAFRASRARVEVPLGVVMTNQECTNHEYRYWGHATHPTEEGPETVGVYKCATCGDFTVNAGLPVEVHADQLAKAIIYMQEMFGGFRDCGQTML